MILGLLGLEYELIHIDRAIQTTDDHRHKFNPRL